MSFSTWLHNMKNKNDRFIHLKTDISSAKCKLMDTEQILWKKRTRMHTLYFLGLIVRQNMQMNLQLISTGFFVSFKQNECWRFELFLCLWGTSSGAYTFSAVMGFTHLWPQTGLISSRKKTDRLIYPRYNVSAQRGTTEEIFFFWLC